MPSAGFLTMDWSPNSDPLSPGGSSWYRCLLPMVELNERGWQSAMGLPGWDDAKGFGLRHAPGSMLTGWSVLVFKHMMSSDTPEQVRRAQALGQKVVVDIDDFHAEIHPDNVAAKGTDPMLNPDLNRDFYEQVIEAADMITVSTPFLLDYYADRHPCVRLIRNGIDFGRYSRIRDRAGWQPTIGWVGGIPWRSGDLETLRDWLPAFVGEHDLRVHHSGHIDNGLEPFWTKAGVEQSRMSTLPAALILDYPTLFTGFEVGIVPLNDIPFNHAKSTVKGLEYAASGIPFVAAATPEYVRLAELGIGRVASTPDEWVKHLTDLLDPAVRRREAAAQRALVSREFSMRERGAEWADVLGEVLTMPSRASGRAARPAEAAASERAATSPESTTSASRAQAVGEVRGIDPAFNLFIPPYQEPLAHMYGGVRALNQLAKELANRGCQVVVNAPNTDPVAIYPEVVSDNPFRADRRVRWLLNEADHPGEVCYGWTQAMGDHPLLTVNIIEMNLWRRAKRRGRKVAYWVGKGVADPALIPEGAIEISRTNFPVRRELAQFVSELDHLISFDPFSSMNMEATIAGTPVLMHVPGKQVVNSRGGYVDQPWSRERLEEQGWGTYGLAWHPDELEQARATVHLQRAHYAGMIRIFDQRVDAFVEDIPGLFG